MVMRKTVAILGPPDRWVPLFREYRQLADFICVSPVRAEPIDDSNFSLFLVDLFSGRFDVLVATCPTVIESMVWMAEGRKMLDRMREAISRTELVVIGERTSDCAIRHGLKVASTAPEATTDSLVEHINRLSRRGTAALLRSDQGSPQMVEDLENTGWKVEQLAVYSILLDEGEEMEQLLDRLEEGRIDILVFPTPAHAKAFMVHLNERGGRENALLLLEGVAIAAMGRETREFLEGYGAKVSLVPERASAESMVRSLLSRIED